MIRRFWAAGTTMSGQGSLSGLECDERPGGRWAAKRAPINKDGIEWLERQRAAERAPNVQEGSEHRTVPSGLEGVEWSGGHRVVRKPSSQEGASDWQGTEFE